MTALGKRIIIIAGPNGAGKTTFAAGHLKRILSGAEFVNADWIASDLSSVSGMAADARAGKMMLCKLADLAARGENFALETTLSGGWLARRIPQWQSRGYRVSLYYLSILSAEESANRVSLRVRQGGHDIPLAVIRRRFDKSLQNFHNLYKPLVDDWRYFDNRGERPILLDSGEKR